jgi:hypothetical protein
MELHLHSHHFERRLPNWRAVAISGILAGAVLLLLASILVVATGGNVWGPFRMVAAIALGKSVFVQPTSFDAAMVVVALAVHFALAVAFAIVLSVLMVAFNFDSSLGIASLTGAVFGLIIYVANFYGMTAAFDWFLETRTWTNCGLHIVYGLIVAISYTRIEIIRKMREGQLAR